MDSIRRTHFVFAAATAVTTIGALGLLSARIPPHLPDLLTFLVAVVVTRWAARFQVPLRKTKDPNQATTVSLRFVATLFLITTQTDWDCLWILAAISVFDARKVSEDREKLWFNFAFSVNATTLAILVGSVSQNLRLPVIPRVILETFAVALVYHLVSVAQISAAMACHGGGKFRNHFVFLYQTVLGYLTGAALVAAGRLVLINNPSPWALLPVAVLAVPVSLIILREQTLRRERDEEHQRRIEEQQLYIAELENKKSELQQRQAEIEHMYASTVEAFALAIDAKDRYTQEHIQRVKKVAVGIAVEMGLVDDELRAIEVGAALHDIGKIAIPEHILNKPGRLTNEEFELIKRHAEMGARILQPVHFPYPVMGVVRSHHEKWDGTGYPDGLAAEDIPLGGRILAVADVYDALTSDRPYRDSWDHDRAASYLSDQAGTHFDPEVVDAFHRAMENDTSLKALLVAKQPVSNPLGDEINRAAFEYRAVFDVSRAITDSAGVAETEAKVLAAIRSCYDATCCVLTLKNENELLVSAHDGENSKHFAGARVDRQDGPTAETFNTGQGRFGPYDSADLMLTAATEPWIPLKSHAIAAIRSEDGNIVGTINVYSSAEGRFQSEDVRVLEALASMVAHALANANDHNDTGVAISPDALTGLPDGSALTEIMPRWIRRHAVRRFTAVRFDIVQLRLLNQKYGYETGNAVLRWIGDTLIDTTSDGWAVFRIKSDNFVVLVPTSSDENPQSISKKIQKMIENPYPLHFVSRKSRKISLTFTEYTFEVSLGESNSVQAIAEKLLRDSQVLAVGQEAA